MRLPYTPPLDETKHAINSIDVRQVEGGIRVASTNGHVLFTCVVPTQQGYWWAPEHPLLSLDPAAFKAVPKKKQFVAKFKFPVLLSLGMVATFLAVASGSVA